MEMRTAIMEVQNLQGEVLKRKVFFANQEERKMDISELSSITYRIRIIDEKGVKSTQLEKTA